LQNLPKPTDSKIFETVTTLLPSSTLKSRDTKTRTNIEHLARTNLDIVP